MARDKAAPTRQDQGRSKSAAWWLAAACWSLAAITPSSALRAVDLDVNVRTTQPTSIQQVMYRIGTVTQSVDGSVATTPVRFQLPNQIAGTKQLLTTFGTYSFVLSDAGEISVSAGQPLHVEGNHLVIENEISYPQITLKTLQSTSLERVGARLRAYSAFGPQQQGDVQFVDGAAAPAGVTFPFSGMAKGQAFELLTSYGVVAFVLNESGDISVVSDPASSSISAPASSDAGSRTVVISNTISFPELTLRTLHPTSLDRVGARFRVNEYVGPQEQGAVQYVAGSEATTGVQFPFEGMAWNQTFELLTSYGVITFVLTESGDISIASDPVHYNYVAPAFSEPGSHAVTISNTISFPALTLKTVQPTSLDRVGARFRVNEYAGPQEQGTVRYVDGSEATTGVQFPFEGMAWNQTFELLTSYGVITFVLTEPGDILIASDPAKYDYVAPASSEPGSHTVTIKNTISFPTLTLRTLQPTSLDRVGARFRVNEYVGPQEQGVTQYVAGADATTGVQFPFEGMAWNQTFELLTSYGVITFVLTESGEISIASDPARYDYVAPASGPAGERSVSILNTLDRRLRVSADHGSSLPTVTLSLAVPEYVPASILPSVTVPGTDLGSGVEFDLLGIAANQDCRLLTPFGYVPFRFSLAGDTLFFAPATQLTNTTGSLSIESGSNTLFLEVLPSNRAPEIDAGGNMTLASFEQSATTLTAFAFDPDGDTMSCRWLLAGEVVQDWSAVTGGSCALALGSIDPLGRAGHRFRLEVTDGVVTVIDDVVVTIENTAPEIAASGGGTYELGDDVALGATVADFDGDSLGYRWTFGELELAAGSATAPFGGDPVLLEPIVTRSTDLGLGDHELALSVTDGNASVSRPVTVIVQDTTAPTLAPVATPAILWPPNHEMVLVTIQANAADSSGSPVELAVEVESDEPAEFDGSGNFVPDHEVLNIDPLTGTILLSLRAERSGKGDGRVYIVVVTATDVAGNSSTATATIVAPHSRGR